jgi:WhiB family transcriptional regulator, redox-sensing transcriptional regulator
VTEQTATGATTRTDLEWLDWGMCAQTDPEAYYPEKSASPRAAQRVCAGCPVTSECLEWALANGERFGVWGGKTERERRKIARARRAPQKRAA